MDFPTQNSSCQQFFLAYSFKRCFFFLLIFVVFVIAALGAATFIIIFILKPREPIFSLQTVKLDSYKLEVYSNSTLFVSSVVSLTLDAQNPNKVGIRYGSSRLHVLNEGLVIGMIRIPGFYQPAHSKNVSVETRVLFQCVNVTQVLSGVSLQDDSIAKMRILGDIRAHVRIFHITLPNIKVALDCDINIDYKYLTLSNEVLSMRAVQNQLASFPATSQTFSKKCSIAFYI